MSIQDFLPPRWVPHEYQQRGLAWLAVRPAAILCWLPGLGKTAAMLATLRRLHDGGFAKRTLVLAPLPVARTTWLSEPKKWAQFCDFRVQLAHGPLKEQILLDLTNEIVVLNYEAIPWVAPILAKHPKLFDVLVCDEITQLKHYNTKRFKAIKPVLHNFKFRYGLTGTPAANGHMDLFGQLFVIDLGARLGRYITQFRLKYFHQTPWGRYTWHISPEKEQQLLNTVKDVMLFVNPEDYFEMPPLIHVERPVWLPPAVLKDYKTLERLYILKLQAEQVITVANAAVLTSKLRQCTSGVVYAESGEPLVLHTHKLDALAELVEELAGESLFVAYNFTTELNMILEKFPDALVLKGGMSDKATKEVLDAWNAGGRRLLLAQADMAALGLNLQFGGSAVCWYSQTYNLQTYTQLIARLWRQGQKNTVRCFHLVAEGTIDQRVAKVLVDKAATQQKLFDAIVESTEVTTGSLIKDAASMAKAVFAASFEE